MKIGIQRIKILLFPLSTKEYQHWKRHLHAFTYLHHLLLTRMSYMYVYVDKMNLYHDISILRNRV